MKHSITYNLLWPKAEFKPGAHRCRNRHMQATAHSWFLEITEVQASVRMHVCVSPQAINYYSSVMKPE